MSCMVCFGLTHIVSAGIFSPCFLHTQINPSLYDHRWLCGFGIAYGVDNFVESREACGACGFMGNSGFVGAISDTEIGAEKGASLDTATSFKQAQFLLQMGYAVTVVGIPVGYVC